MFPNTMSGLIRAVVNREALPVLRWARKHQTLEELLAECDPAEPVDISPLISADSKAERISNLSPAERLELLNRFWQMTADYFPIPAGQKYDGIRPLNKGTQLALWISLGTLHQIGEFLHAEWTKWIWTN